MVVPCPECGDISRDDFSLTRGRWGAFGTEEPWSTARVLDGAVGTRFDRVAGRNRGGGASLSSDHASGSAPLWEVRRRFIRYHTSTAPSTRTMTAATAPPMAAPRFVLRNTRYHLVTSISRSLAYIEPVLFEVTGTGDLWVHQ